MPSADLIEVYETELQWLESKQREEGTNPHEVIHDIKKRLHPLVAQAAQLSESEAPVMPKEVDDLWLPKISALTTAIILVKRLRAWASARAAAAAPPGAQLSAPTEYRGNVLPPEQTSPVARAIALMVEAQRKGRPIPQVKTLAEIVGVHRSTLNRDRTFNAARKAALLPTAPRRGWRNDRGDVDTEAD